MQFQIEILSRCYALRIPSQPFIFSPLDAEWVVWALEELGFITLKKSESSINVSGEKFKSCGTCSGKVY